MPGEITAMLEVEAALRVVDAAILELEAAQQRLNEVRQQAQQRASSGERLRLITNGRPD